MNKAIADGLVLQPKPFAAGLGLWSTGDGTPCSDTLVPSDHAQLVKDDVHFGCCLEMSKTTSLCRLRYKGEMPIMPGCYLRITARVKAESGPLPKVRIAGFAGDFQSNPVPGLDLTGPAKAIPAYGEVVEVSAIVGTGTRTGVDLVWQGAAFGHFGIDLTGPTGGVVRVADLMIEDITAIFHRDLLACLDVRDFGAVGDGITDDSAAFLAADAAAQGREVLVSEGIFRLDADVAMTNRVRFQGHVRQGAAYHFILLKDFGYAIYLDAFGDDALAFRKAYQALLNSGDCDTLDLNGRRIALSAPMDMQAADPYRASISSRRMIRNGQIDAVPGPAWGKITTTSQARSNADAPRTLTDVAEIADVRRGALVSGTGVGREVYVVAKDEARRTVTLSQPLYQCDGLHWYNFTRFQYLLDFSEYDHLAEMQFADVVLDCHGTCSGVLLASNGHGFELKDCAIKQVADRAVTSIGRGCAGLTLDGCKIDKQSRADPADATVAINAHANDVAIRSTSITGFDQSCVLAGAGNTLSGNHLYGTGQGGITLTRPDCASVVSGNYSEDCLIIWTNEHSAHSETSGPFAFGGLTITGNILLSTRAATDFSFFVIKPQGPDHFIHGLSVVSNVFRANAGPMARVERIDTTQGDLDMARAGAISFAHNLFQGISQPAFNPAVVTHDQTAPKELWVAAPQDRLPFQSKAQSVDGLTLTGPIVDRAGQAVFEAPYAQCDENQLCFVFKTAVTGQIRYQVRMDKPQ